MRQNEFTPSVFLTPVLIIAFNRPDKIEHLLKELIQQGVRNLFVSIDGPRNDAEAIDCAETRKVVEDYANHFDLTLAWRDSNLGCGLGVVAALDWFFGENPNGIILEDDCIPEPLMLETLEKKLHSVGNNRIGMVTAHNPFVTWPEESVSSYFLIQGWGTTSKIWESVRQDFFKLTLPQLSKTSRRGRSISESIFWWANSNRARLGGVDTWDGIFSDQMWRLKFRTWVPSVNLIRNFGFDSRATHTIDPAGSIFVIVPNEQKVDFDRLLRDKYFGITRRHAFSAPVKVFLDLLRPGKQNQEEILKHDVQVRRTKKYHLT